MFANKILLNFYLQKFLKLFIAGVYIQARSSQQSPGLEFNDPVHSIEWDRSHTTEFEALAVTESELRSSRNDNYHSGIEVLKALIPAGCLRSIGNPHRLRSQRVATQAAAPELSRTSGRLSEPLAYLVCAADLKYYFKTRRQLLNAYNGGGFYEESAGR